VENLPLIYLEFKEMELDRQELDKQEVELPEVDRVDLDEPGVVMSSAHRCHLYLRYIDSAPSKVLLGSATRRLSSRYQIRRRNRGGLISEEEHADYPTDGRGMEMMSPPMMTLMSDNADDDYEPIEGRGEAFETDESAPTPRAPQIRIPFARHVSGTGILMRAAVASPPLSLPPTAPRTDIPEADMPPRKRACHTTPSSLYKIGRARDPEPQDAPAETGSSISHASFEAILCQAYKIQGTEGVRWPDPIGRKYVNRYFPKQQQCITNHVKFGNLYSQRKSLDVEETFTQGLSDRMCIYNPWTALKRLITISNALGRNAKRWKSEMFPEVAAKSWKAERQAENKRKYEETSRNTQNQQQPFKRNNVARAYTAGLEIRSHRRNQTSKRPRCIITTDGHELTSALLVKRQSLAGAVRHYRSDSPISEE
ncbi:hypothetical protein Tco_0038362, partial [Tanacetum coccineum]